MRYIDRTDKTFREKGTEWEIKTSWRGLTTAAIRKAEKNGLAVLKTSWGPYKVIKASGLGAGISETFETLTEVDGFLKTLH